jgi:hypothetical protein
MIINSVTSTTFGENSDELRVVIVNDLAQDVQHAQVVRMLFLHQGVLVTSNFGESRLKHFIDLL